MSHDVIFALDIAPIIDIGERITAFAARQADPLARTYYEVLVAPVTWCVMLGILVLERFVPARPQVRTFSLGFAQDAIYFLVTTAANFAIATTYVWALRAVYDEYLSFLTITPLLSLPHGARLVFAVF